MIDAFTRKHLRDWIDHTLIDPPADVYQRMLEEFSTDPEFYSRNSWWKCYDSIAQEDS